MVAGGGDCLEVFPAENRADARSARRALLAEYAGVAYEIFAGRADGDDAALYTAAVVAVEYLMDLLLRFGNALAPNALVVGIVENKAVVINLEPGMLGASAREDKCVVAGLLQVVTEAAAAV